MNEILVASAKGLLQKAIDFLVGGKAIEKIKYLIVIYDSKDMTDEEKRKAVKAEVMPFVKSFGKEFVNVAIAIAVTMMRAQIASLATTEKKQ